MLARLAGSSLSRQEKVEHLFLSAVARKPNRRELELAESMFTASMFTQSIFAESMFAAQDEAETLQTIWWALLNSNEFILDH